MTGVTLAELLERNERHADGLDFDYFDAVQLGQRPAIVSICCSDSRVSQEGMWSVEEPGWLFTASNIGNRVWSTVDGDRVVDGSVCYPIEYTDTNTVAVVGHTGCGAITAAYEAVAGDGQTDDDVPPGVADNIESLRGVIESGLESIDETAHSDRDAIVNRLVEHNVDRQIEFLQNSPDVPDDESILGFVYDFQGGYRTVRGRCYLTNIDGETDVDRLEAQVPDGYTDYVRRLQRSE
ncbi:MAG: carbonic anhydrase [Natronomonas sp.]